MLHRASIVVLLLACSSPTAQDGGPTANLTGDTVPTLRQAMADPDWLGRAPESPWWSVDSRHVYYRRKVEGEEARDVWRHDVTTGETVRLEPAEQVVADVAGGDWTADRTRKVFARNGDLFLAGTDGTVKQLTRTEARESSPAFLAGDDRIVFSRGGEVYVRELATGLELQPAVVELADDPLAEEDEDGDYVEEQQERLLDVVRERKARREAERRRDRALHLADPTRTPVPFYLGEGRERVGAHLSPDARWMVLRVAKESRGSGKRDEMPRYVTDSSWVETDRVRAHVGYADDRSTELVLLDLENHEHHELDLSVLPGIDEDPLAWLKAKDDAEEDGAEEDDAQKDDAEKSDTEEDDPEADDGGDAEPAEAKPRNVSIWSVEWSPDSSQVVFLARANDNKDRWIARIDLEAKAVEPVHRLTDEAWINWRYNELGWLEGSNTLWFTSEETGWSQLYLWTADAGVRPLTSGRFEIDQVTEHPDGASLWFRANLEHPGVHEVCRVSLADGTVEKVTSLGGRSTGSLSPDGTRLVVSSSSVLTPTELFLQDARPGAEATRITDTVSDEFRSFAWIEPELVEVPSRHGTPIHGRLYLPDSDADAPRPVVCFVHGAGYLQNAHRGWSGYFREFMFHSVLVHAGFVVLDLDYRASAGYGRDWRTAIYRGMGTPELDDYDDALAWLAEREDVDLDRVGIYGGSYGGFIALMALFQRADRYACGAALRPVTDWAHYNHGYTSNILNTPEADPEAYERSSPIEFADGLEDPLLICHGLVDNNVLAKDSIRLAQRLIELEKEDWELMLYPVEPHGFREPSSWLDEYRRIFALFQEHLATD